MTGVQTCALPICFPVTIDGDLTREATSDEVAELRKENQRLKEIVADLVLRYDIVKKTSEILG